MDNTIADTAASAAQTGAQQGLQFGPLQIIVIIAVVVLAALVVLFVRKRIRMSRDPEYAAKVSKKAADRDLARQKRKMERAELKVKKARYKEATAPARAELNRAKADYNNRVKRAEDALRHANSEHEKAVREQEKKISEIDKRFSRNLATVGSVKLFVDRLEVQDSVIQLNDSFSAEVLRGTELLSGGGSHREFRFAQTPEGERPSAAGQPIGGIGSPELPWEIAARPDYCYLFVTGSCTEYGGKTLCICVPLDDRRLDAGDTLAEQMAVAAPEAAANARKRERELAEAREEKSRVEADTLAIENAEKTLEVEKGRNQEVVAAQQNLEEVEQRASAELDYKP